MMLRSGCTFKKRRELTALVNYYDSKLTGDQVVKEFNECVKAGIRNGYERSSRLPLTYIEGKKLQARLAGERAGMAHLKANAATRRKIIDDRVRLGLSVKKLASMHHVSATTVSRILREALGTPRLGRIGDQATLD